MLSRRTWRTWRNKGFRRTTIILVRIRSFPLGDRGLSGALAGVPRTSPLNRPSYSSLSLSYPCRGIPSQ